MNGFQNVLSKADQTLVAKYNPNLVKINRSYTFEELARVLNVHKNTVADWVKKGLPCLKDRRPFLILGAEAKAYLQKARRTNKQRCKPDELYCVRCRAPSKPAENYLEYLPLSASKGRLSGFCGRCECIVNKFVSLNSLPRYQQIFDIPNTTAWKHLDDSDEPLLNSDFQR